MIDQGIRFTCDACQKSTFVKSEMEAEQWRRNTEIGDLCPACARAWDGFKESFVQKMRLDCHGKN